MRTQDEISKHMKEIENDDFCGFQRQVLGQYLDIEHAKEHFKAIKDEWNQTPLENALDDMKEYMEFAWRKVEDHRGLSAGRSVEKMEAWLWLLEDFETLNAVKETSYENYGTPKLAVICRKYDCPIPDDDGIRNMINSKPCRIGCEEGCGQ
jgi:hypothetical protein